MLAAILFGCVVAVSAQEPQPCDGPASFTANFRHLDRERNYYVEGKMYYDRDNRRVREFEFRDINSDKEYYDRLKLYNENIEYTLDLKKRNCSTGTPRPDWHPWGVPPDAKFRGEGTIGVQGVPNEMVTIAFFEGMMGPDPYFVSVTQPDCFVVEFGVFGNRTGFDHREFFDVVNGITDPMAFIPPRECS